MTSRQNMAKHGGEGQYRSDQYVSMSDSNVFSLTEKGEDSSDFTTIFSPNLDLVVGFGTSTPSSRLSFGKNTSNVLGDELIKESIPGVCFNEESNGTDATGITYYERFDNVTGQRAEAGMAFLVSNENYETNSDTTFSNTLETENKNIPMSILSRTSGQNTVLINHNPTKTTERAIFSNERVSMDISGAIRTSQFVILGINSDLLQSTDFNILNNGALLFDGTNLYIKQIGVDVPTQLLLRNDATFGTTTNFLGYSPGDSTQGKVATLGIYQPTPTLFGATMSNDEENIFRNALSVAGNIILGTKPYINHIVNIYNGDPQIPTPGIISTQTGIGVNVFAVKAGLEINTQNQPFIIMGINNSKSDISYNTFVSGDNNIAVDAKSNVFGDNNMLSGQYGFLLGNRNNTTGNDIFIRGDDNQNLGRKNYIFGDLNITLDNDYLTSELHHYNLICGVENQITDCSASVAIGKQNNNNNSDYSVEFGLNNDINNSDYSITLGVNNSIYNSPYSFGVGLNTDISDNHYSVAMGYNATTRGTNRFSFGTLENNGNVFTIDMSGNVITEGDILCLVNKNKGLYENCDHNITIGNSNSLTIIPGEFANYSDVRLKKNIQTIQNSLDKVCNLRGVTYNRNDTLDDNQQHIGLIAQEVQKVIPEVVNVGKDNGYLSVSYGNIVSVLIESIKELNTNIEKLEQENKTLKTDVDTLKNQMKTVLDTIKLI